MRIRRGRRPFAGSLRSVFPPGPLRALRAELSSASISGAWSARSLWPPDIDHLPRVRRFNVLTRVAFGVFAALGATAVAASASLIDTRAEAAAIAASLTMLSLGVAVLCAGRSSRHGLALLLGSVIAGGWGVEEGAVGAQVLGVFGFALVISYPPRRVLRGLAVGEGTYLLVRALSAPDDLLRGVDDVVLTAAVTMATSFFALVLVARTTEAERLRVTRLSSDLAEHVQRIAAAELAHSRQIMHDEVIGTLRLVADAAGEDDELHQAAQKALTRIDSPQDSAAEVSAGRLLRELTDTSPVSVDLHADLNDPNAHVELRPAVVGAVRRAVQELLRNVKRHSGERSAELRWSCQDARHHLEVIDHGCGMGDRGIGWGVRHSVVVPLEEIGGIVRFDDVPGGGTRVVLTWPHHPTSRAESSLARARRETVLAIGGDVRVLEVLAFPLLAGHLYLGVRNSWGDQTVVGQLSLGLFVAVTVVIVLGVVQRRGLRAWEVALLGLATGATMFAGLWLAEPAAVETHDSWILGCASTILALVAFLVPLRWVFVVAAPSWLLVALWFWQSTEAEVLSAGGAVAAIVVPPLVGFVLGHLMRQASHEIRSQAQLLAEVTASVQRHRNQLDGVRDPMRLVRDRVVPWFRDVAEGRLSPGDAETRRQAAQLAQEVRDELHLPGVLDPALRHRLRTARSAGVAVVLQPLDEQPLETSVSLRLLDRALDLEPRPRRILLWLPSRAVHRGPAWWWCRPCLRASSRL